MVTFFYLGCGDCGAGWFSPRPEVTYLMNYRMHLMHDHTALFRIQSRWVMTAYGRDVARRREERILKIVLGG